MRDENTASIVAAATKAWEAEAFQKLVEGLSAGCESSWETHFDRLISTHFSWSVDWIYQQETPIPSRLQRSKDDPVCAALESFCPDCTIANLLALALPNEGLRTTSSCYSHPYSGNFKYSITFGVTDSEPYRGQNRGQSIGGWERVAYWGNSLGAKYGDRLLRTILTGIDELPNRAAELGLNVTPEARAEFAQVLKSYCPRRDPVLFFRHYGGLPLRWVIQKIDSIPDYGRGHREIRKR